MVEDRKDGTYVLIAVSITAKVVRDGQHTKITMDFICGSSIPCPAYQVEHKALVPQFRLP